MPHVMSVTVLPNVSARSLVVRETVKKSKASHVYSGGIDQFFYQAQTERDCHR